MSTFKIFCPVCGKIIEARYYSSVLGIEEEHICCPYCNYAETFVYGLWGSAVGNKTYYSYHSDNEQYRILVGRRYKKALFMAKRNWRKYHKKTTTELNFN
nr:hypothetical protein YSBCXYJI_YSBCXYJI_CDS_0045 [Caudoviricetes sp.]